MEYRILGKTGLKVSVVGFGGIPIMKVQDEEATRIINRAVDLRINFFHTAPSYGDSASKVGKALRDRRDECILNVKLFGITKERTQKELEKALEMLRTDRIEIAQFRITEEEFDQGIGEDGGLQVLLEAQKNEVVDYIGITDHDPKFLTKAIDVDCFSNFVVPFNFVYNGAEEQLIPKAKKMNLGIVAMKPLGKGKLLNVSEALNYIWEHGVPTTIVGMQSIKEVEENAHIGEKVQPLTSGQKENLRTLAEELRRKYKVSQGALLPLGA